MVSSQLPIDFCLGPFYLGAAIVSAVLSRAVRQCERRQTWLVVVLRVLACALSFRFGWLLAEALP